MLMASDAAKSAGTPQWAGLTVLATQIAGKRLGLLNPTLYRLASRPTTSAAFRDITVGNNSLDGVAGYNATRGWDAATGLGTPDAVLLVPLLARGAAGGD